jgi:glycerol-3-phosphate dehydrogenase subunit C
MTIAGGVPQTVEATLDNCIKCNICVIACPVAAVTDAFPGPKYEGPQAARFRHSSQPAPDRSVDYCSGCRVCNEVCPTGVRIAEINARARAKMVADGMVKGRLRLRNNLLARPLLLARAGAPVKGLVNTGFRFRPARWAAEKLLGIHRQAPLPMYAAGPRFRRWLATHVSANGTNGQVVYFPGCSTEHYETRVGRTAVLVLEALGFDVIVPEPSCCGLPLLSNGEFEAAARYHRKNVVALVDHARAGRAIVGTSTSCTLTLKEEAPDLLDAHDSDSELVASRTFDFNEFVLGLAAEGRLPELAPVEMTLPYHQPCQYRAHWLGAPSVEVMELIPGVQVIESGVACCGIAGTYGYKVEKYQIAMDVGRPLFDFVAREGQSVVACDSETCRWQITHATGVATIHPIEVLALSLGLEVEGPLLG